MRINLAAIFLPAAASLLAQTVGPSPSGAGGTINSIATGCGATGGPITVSGTISSTGPCYAAGGGTAQVQTAIYSPAITLTAGQWACWLPIAANTGPGTTFAPNGLTAHTIVKANGAALVANDIITTAVACAIYDATGTQWELQNQQSGDASNWINIPVANALSGSLLSPANGGTGVNNAARTITLSGNFATTGAFNPTIAVPSSSTWTLVSGGGVIPVASLAGAAKYLVYDSAAGSIGEDTSGCTIDTANHVLVCPAGAAAHPTLAVGTNAGIYSSGSGQLDVSLNGARYFTFKNTGLQMATNQQVTISDGATAKYLYIGTGNGDSSGATVSAQNILTSGVTVGNLPSCASATLGTRRLVTDATVATPGSTAVGSGTFSIAVECTFNSTGSVYTWIID